MPERSDWSVPWPDGSWLTWNEETESWEKQDGPPPTTDPPASADKPADEAPPAEKTPAKKTPAKKTPAKKATPASADAKKAPAPKPTGKKTTTTQKSAKAPAPKTGSTVATAPQAPAAKDGTSGTPATTGSASAGASTEQRWSWQPMADVEGQPSPRQRVTSVSNRSSGMPRSTVGRSQESLMPLVAGGVVAGVVAGYFLVNLIR